MLLDGPCSEQSRVHILVPDRQKFVLVQMSMKISVPVRHKFVLTTSTKISTEIFPPIVSSEQQNPFFPHKQTSDMKRKSTSPDRERTKETAKQKRIRLESIDWDFEQNRLQKVFTLRFELACAKAEKAVYDKKKDHLWLTCPECQGQGHPLSALSYDKYVCEKNHTWWPGLGLCLPPAEQKGDPSLSASERLKRYMGPTLFTDIRKAQIMAQAQLLREHAKQLLSLARGHIVSDQTLASHSSSKDAPSASVDQV
jgi:hypothetical protein